jgi:type II restriction enzyme
MHPKVAEALEILSALGIPMNGLTQRRKEKMAKAFMAVADVKPSTPWSAAKDNHAQHQLQSRQIITFLNTYWEETISPGSYDDIRRKDLALPVAGHIVLKSAKNPDANTNDGTRGFAIDPAAGAVIRTFGTRRWPAALKAFNLNRPTLAAQLKRDRDLARIPVQLNGQTRLDFSPGKHSELQKSIIEVFLPIFGFGAQVLYVGDTAKKDLFLDAAGLKKLYFFELAHDALPDVVAYCQDRNWLYLIEAVTTANPITELRRKALLQAASTCSADIILVTAFPDRSIYRKFAHAIAWETEVWIADAPEHMIHFNGDKFLGPYKQKAD